MVFADRNKTGKNKILLVTGYSGSGKSELANMLREEFDGAVVSTGGVMRAIANERGFERLSEFIATVGVRDSFGIARDSIVDKINTLISSNVIVDGMYDCVLADMIVNRFGKRNICVIDVLADASVRIERVAARNRTDIAGGVKEVIRRDLIKVNAGINEVILRSDFIIKNNSGVNELRVKSHSLTRCVFDG